MLAWMVSWLPAAELFGDSVLKFMSVCKDEFTSGCEDEVDRILRSIPADIKQAEIPSQV